MPAASTEPSACLAGWKRFARSRVAGYQPRRSIELVIFTSEEPTRFGIGCLGSRLLCGLLDPDTAGARVDRDGVSLDNARWAAGFEGPLASVRLPPGYYSAFVEMHIEQGPILERNNVPLGVVTAIAAPASLKITIEGEGGHAGAVLMPDRHDAFLAAAEIALAVETSARSSGSNDTVGTVGVCDVFPGAVNSIPSRVRMEIDVRDTDEARRDCCVAKNQAGLRGSRGSPGCQSKLGTRQCRSSGALRPACRGYSGPSLRNARTNVPSA